MDRPATPRHRPGATVLAGIAMLGLGGLLVLRPVASASALVPWLVVGLLLAAVSQVPLAGRVRTSRLATAGVWVAAALTVVAWPEPTTAVLAWGLGAGLVLGGVLELVGAGRAVRGSNLRFVVFAAGLTHLGLGAAVLLWPSISAFTLGVVLSLWLLTFGSRVIVQGSDRLRRADGAVAGSRWSLAARSAGSAVLLLLAVLAVGAALIIEYDTTPDPGPFYATPASFDLTPGTLLRQELIAPFVPGGTAYRVLYTSRDLDDTPVTKSGVVVIPDGPPPPGGVRPILAHTHGTIGIDRSCAPSLLGEAYAPQLWGLEELLRDGWIIAAPDYLGLGGEGDHPYLVGAAAAQGTVDIVRAAAALDGGSAARRFAVAGHSQGGHAALFTAERAATLAPELELIAAAGIAPASELAAFIEANDGTLFGNLLGAYAVAAWDRVFDDIDAASIVDAAVLPIVERLAGTCLAVGPEAIALLLQAELLHLGFLLDPIWDTEPWAGRIAENTPGSTAFDAPLLIVQGDRDSLIRPDIQRRFVARLCAGGQHVTYREIAGAGHLDVDDAAAGLVVDWLTDRRDGVPAASTCPSR